jgi:hypothetical protein
MGHWAESLVDEVAQQIGGNPDRRLLMDLAAQAGRELEVLSGRSFRPLRRMTSVFETNGLPFADIPDMQVGSMDSMAGVREIPDPVDPQIAAVLQGPPLPNPAPNAAPAADALWVAGQLVAEASRTGRLSGDYVLHWLGASMDREQRVELMRRVMDPVVRFSVPILAFYAEGWWIQIARRLIWVTSDTEDEGRLIELLVDNRRTGGEVAPLAAVEPILIAARMTRQPADWAFTARIWTERVRRPTRPWRKIAKAIHGHGIPTITLDPVSTPLRDRVPGGLEGVLARVHRQRRASTGERRREGVPAAGRAHSARYPCSGQCVCGRDAARTADPPRIRPGSRRGGGPSVRAP